MLTASATVRLRVPLYNSSGVTRRWQREVVGKTATTVSDGSCVPIGFDRMSNIHDTDYACAVHQHESTHQYKCFSGV